MDSVAIHVLLFTVHLLLVSKHSRRRPELLGARQSTPEDRSLRKCSYYVVGEDVVQYCRLAGSSDTCVACSLCPICSPRNGSICLNLYGYVSQYHGVLCHRLGANANQRTSYMMHGSLTSEVINLISLLARSLLGKSFM